MPKRPAKSQARFSTLRTSLLREEIHSRVRSIIFWVRYARPEIRNRLGTACLKTSQERSEEGREAMKLLRGALAVLSASVLAATVSAVAQTSYPQKPVRILVGFPSGGPPDITARLLADKLSEVWAQPVIVENVTGAGGNIAIDRTVKAPPDGYTLVMASSAITIHPSLSEKAIYDPLKDLVPISVAVSTPSILVVNNEVPAKNMQELIALARAQPGKLTYGHAGLGTPAHLSGEVLKSLGGIDIMPVSYRGIPALLPDLIAGRLTMTLPNMSVVLPLVREGKLRALGVISPQRAESAPDLP